MAPVWKFPCGLCGKPVKRNQAGLQCEVCLYWLHCRCLGYSRSNYEGLQRSEESWYCPCCLLEALPFGDCSTISSANDQQPRDQDQGHSSSPSAHHAGSPGGPILPSKTPPPHASRVRSNHSLFYTNCRSLLPKIDELRLLASSSQPTFLALTET